MIRPKACHHRKSEYSVSWCAQLAAAGVGGQLVHNVQHEAYFAVQVLFLITKPLMLQAHLSCKRHHVPTMYCTAA